MITNADVGDTGANYPSRRIIKNSIIVEEKSINRIVPKRIVFLCFLALEWN